MKVRRKKKTGIPTGRNPVPEASSLTLEEFLNHKPVKRSRERKASLFDVALQDAERRSENGDWEGSKTSTFVGLYGFCHQLVYGMKASDLDDKGEYMKATRYVANVLRNDPFDKMSADEIVEFVKWVWDRERGREQWAARTGVDRRRLQIFRCFKRDTHIEYTMNLNKRSLSKRV